MVPGVPPEAREAEFRSNPQPSELRRRRAPHSALKAVSGAGEAAQTVHRTRAEVGEAEVRQWLPLGRAHHARALEHAGSVQRQRRGCGAHERGQTDEAESHREGPSRSRDVRKQRQEAQAGIFSL